MRRALTRSLLACGLACAPAAAGCKREAPPSPAPTTEVAPAAPPAPAAVPAAVRAPAPPPPAAADAVTRADVERASAWLAERLRAPVRAPDDPWTLAHGLLAFGPTLEAREGDLAVDAIARFATPRKVGGAVRYGFEATLDDKPIEPHPYLYVFKLLLATGDVTRRIELADRTRITLGRLVDDMRAVVREPSTDIEWLEAAWWIQAVEIARALDGHVPPKLDLDRLRAATVARLERENAVFTLDPGPTPFAPDAPMGAAKRAKSHIYAHACGGMHFFQAALRAAAASGSADLVARMREQLRLLFARQRAERALYAETLASHPGAALVLRAQQLKFFGHVLETLSLATELGLVEAGSSLAAELDASRRAAAAEIVGAIDALRDLRAYEQLDALAERQPQLRLDLVGDGCHAVRGLGLVAGVLAAEPPR